MANDTLRAALSSADDLLAELHDYVSTDQQAAIVDVRRNSAAALDATDGKTSPADTQGERAEIPLSSVHAIRKAHDTLSEALEEPSRNADEIRTAGVNMCAVLNAAGL